MTASRPIQHAVDHFGGQAPLARELGCTPGLISQWLHGRTPVAAHWCSDIERVTGGKVTCRQLRPDVFRKPS